MMKKVFEIYDIEESYPYQKCRLVAGTLEKCRNEFSNWLIDHKEQYDSEEEFYEEYPNVKLFEDNPQEWVDKFGSDNADLYMDWKLDLICEV
jgi:hypothetical protein